MTQEEYLQIFPAYIGCDIKIWEGSHPNPVTPSAIKEYYLQLDDRGDIWPLVLRSFDQMTEEESTRFRQLADEADKHSYTLWAINATKAVNYLRSIGIDCDGLIEAGYAIKDEKK